MGGSESLPLLLHSDPKVLATPSPSHMAKKGAHWAIPAMPRQSCEKVPRGSGHLAAEVQLEQPAMPWVEHIARMAEVAWSV